MSAASAEERARLHETFAALCRLPSPSGHERRCGELVRERLIAAGVEVAEDDCATALGGDCGNLFARVPGTGDGSILLCGHLDTVPPAERIEPVLRDGGWENAADGILGADNKVAVAVMLAVAERLASAPARTAVELLFTVGEEVSLGGASHFDVAALRSRVGFTFDSSTPLGGVIVASPTYYGLRAELHGTAAHAGVRPENGRSAILAAARAIAAMDLGRIDEESTANIGLIAGGRAANVVPDHCVVEGEVRSLDAGRAERLASQMVECLADAAGDPRCECDLDVSLQRVFDGYRVRPASPEVRLASAALRACGHEPRQIVTGGGSDVNALRARGIAALNLSNGAERAHEPTERISVGALEGLLDLAFALVKHAAAA